jgi:antitoxin component YwqK of YwqJK toxin-antitoxin module
MKVFRVRCCASAVLLCSIFACSEPAREVASHNLAEINGTLFVAGENVPFTGTEVVYRNGRLASTQPVINGLRQGEGFDFCENGRLFARNFYLDGLASGTWEEYDCFEGGWLVHTQQYQKGLHHGDSVHYDRSGSGEVTGRFRWSNGKIIGNMEFR